MPTVAQAQPCAPVQLVVNGSFEQPVLPANGVQSRAPASWQQAERTASLQRGAIDGTRPEPAELQQLVALAPSVTASISQVLVVPYPARFVLSLSYTTLQGMQDSNALVRVVVGAPAAETGSLLIGSQRSQLAPAWTHYQIDGTAQLAGSATLSLINLGSSTAFFDDVRLVIDPAATTLFISGTSTVVLEGGTQTITATLGGAPPLSIQWEIEVRPGEFVAIDDGPNLAGTLSGTSTPSLTLADARPGAYRFRARTSNACGVSTSQAVTLEVRSCPSIDFNNDGLFPSDDDLIDFLSVLAGGPCSSDRCNSIDVNNDGIFPSDEDLLAMLNALAGQAC